MSSGAKSPAGPGRVRSEQLEKDDAVVVRHHDNGVLQPVLGQMLVQDLLVLEHAQEAALVFMSGYTKVRVEDLDMTSEPLIEKPFEVSELARRAAEAIRGKRRGKQSAG